MIDLIFLLKTVPFLLLIEGFFSGSEIALLSADKVSLKGKAAEGSLRAKLALELAQHPERVLSSTLVITSLCVISISSLIAVYCFDRFPQHTDLMSILITSPLIVFLGELIPKTIFQRYATTLAPLVAYPIKVVFILFYPLTKLLSLYTGALGRFLGNVQESITGRGVNKAREEIVSLLSYSKNETNISKNEKEMIQRIFDFKDIQAKQVMIPLVKVEAIDEKASIKDALERFKSHRHSRMPVYSGRIDNITSVLEISDLMTAQDSSLPIRNFVSNSTFIAETHFLKDLIPLLQEEKTELAIVVDEYGGAIGILTMEDIVEEIVGEISDEHDDHLVDYKELGEKKYLIQARMEISHLNQELKIELPEGEYETLGGFLLHQFGKIPETGDELYFDTPAASLKLFVRKANERQIQSVVIEIITDHRMDSNIDTKQEDPT